MNAAQSVGLTMSATKSEASSPMITVFGRYAMNSPMIPGQKIIGTNGAMFVADEATTGQATSRVPFSAAAIGSSPSSWWR